ncbi:hypothetical protein KRR23_14455 [Pseudomonas sp. CVAP|uniref:LysR substrate-binding domain-containing protein n=1 Tax=Pseudomonas sp. CVAP\|nr:hypothetical protein [Pseudomonas sp. CVAP\
MGPPGVGDSSLVVRPLRPYQMVACATPQYLSRSAPLEHPEDLQQHQCLLIRLPAPEWLE